MKWIKVGDNEYYSCKTPIGRYDIVGNSSGYSTYFQSIDRISAEKDLETAKEEARIHLLKTYYSLKIYLEINE